MDPSAVFPTSTLGRDAATTALAQAAALLQAGRPGDAARVMIATPAPFRAGEGQRLSFAVISQLVFSGAIDLARAVLAVAAPEQLPVFDARMTRYRPEMTAAEATRRRGAALAALADDVPRRPPTTRAISLVGRLRVGHLVANAAQSSSEYFRAAEIRHHDRARFRLFHYVSKSAPPNAERRQYDDVWVDARALDDAALFDRLQADRIDILVDHCDINAGARLGLLTARAAPVQISRGAIEPMGIPAVEWRQSDALLHGPGVQERWSETPLTLPCWQCYTPPEDAPPPAQRPTDGAALLFGAFIQPAKLTPSTALAWGRILNATPGSKLLFKRKELAYADAQAQVAGLLHRAGIAPDRLLLAGDSALPDQLAAMAQVDVALDAWPFSGHTTTCEALWMGAPAPSLLGDRVCGRIGASYLAAAGCGDWIARDPDDYVRIVLGLVSDPARLQAIRQGLRAQVAASPLCDGLGHTRALEAAYERAAADWTRRRVALPDKTA